MLVCREPLAAIFCSLRHWMLFSKNCLLAQDIASIKNLCFGNETWSGTVYCLFMIVSSDPGYPLKLRRSRLRILFTRRSKCVTSCGAEWPRSSGRNPVRRWDLNSIVNPWSQVQSPETKSTSSPKSKSPIWTGGDTKITGSTTSPLVTFKISYGLGGLF